jgi:hypothetical protein
MTGMLRPKRLQNVAFRDAACVTVATVRPRCVPLPAMRHLTICLLCLALPTAALAKRPATKPEKAKISKAAHRSKQTDFFDCFKVDHVRISTKGPWAGATLRDCDDEADAIFGLFSRKDGKWKLRRMGNGSVGCDIAPRKVQKDLDLGCP